MLFRALFLATAFFAFPHISTAAEGEPLSAADRAATQNAFERSMHDAEFLAAAQTGEAAAMKRILIDNGAPDDMDLVAQGYSVKSTRGDPVPAEYPINNGICVRWKLVTWYVQYPSPGVPAGWHTMWVCTQIISDVGTITYDAPL